MKKQLIIIIAAFLTGISSITFAQNVPDATVNYGHGTGAVVYPLDFNQSPNTADTLQNIARMYAPLIPVTSVGTFNDTKNQPVIVSTTYTDGFGRPLQEVLRNNTANDIIQVYDYRDRDTVISFLPYADTFHSRFHNQAYGRLATYYYNKYSNEYDAAYSKAVSKKTNGKLTGSGYMPGKETITYNRGTTSTRTFNSANEVKILEYSAGNICTTGSYAAGRLYVNTVQGQHNQEVVQYTDKGGKTVCEKEHAGGTAGNNGWLTTYYIYNELDKLICIVPPKASAQLETGNCLSNITDLCFFYDYDEKGNVIKRTVPGKNGSDYMVYDKNGNLVMVQTPKLRTQHQWFFTAYDALGRSAMTGLFTGTANDSLGYWIGVINGTVTATRSNHLEDYFRYGCGTNMQPGSLSGCEMYTYNYYDDYSIAPANLATFDASGFNSDYLTGTGIETPVFYKYPQGQLVASKVRILDNGVANNFTNTWLTSVYFYDEKGRLIQSHTKNPWNRWDTAAVQYNFVGQPVLEIGKYHAWTGADKPDTKIQNWYEYGSSTGRLNEVKQKIDESIWRSVAVYTYDELGRVIKKMVGGVDEQNYFFDIAGQLNGINSHQITWGWSAIDPTISFMENIYRETGFTTPRYDGKLSGFRWRTKGSYMRTYGYLYDSVGRMKYADYHVYSDTSVVNPGYSWNKHSEDYTVAGLTYDANGNILSMTQRGLDSTFNKADIDILSYTYDSGNKLRKVDDAGTNSLINDFKDGPSIIDDYAYDEDGNQVRDNNKRAVDSVVYNFQGLPVRVKFYNGNTINNVYLSNGTLLQKTIASSTDTITYRYWGPYVYRNDTLDYMLHQEGRARWNADSSFFKYDYFVKDHFGNVRTVITADETPPTTNYLATHEVASANIEELIFSHMGEVRSTRPLSAPENLECATLNGEDEDLRIGTALMLHVMTGDKIDMSAYSYHNGKPEEDIYTTPEDMMLSLIDVLSGGVGGFEGGEEGNGADFINTAVSDENYLDVFDAIKQSATDPNKPRAYLNYITFAEDMSIVPAQSGAIQVSGTANTWEPLALPADLIMEQNGYILIYISAEEHTPVSFDDVDVVVTEGRLLDEQHYYPHGLMISKVSNNTDPVNQFSYQGNKLQDELDLLVSDFNFRQYDQQIGRFMAVDPLADAGGQWAQSPYHFCSNDPANNIDPLGLFDGRAVDCPDDGGKSPRNGKSRLGAWIASIMEKLNNGNGDWGVDFVDNWGPGLSGTGGGVSRNYSAPGRGANGGLGGLTYVWVEKYPAPETMKQKVDRWAKEQKRQLEQYNTAVIWQSVEDRNSGSQTGFWNTGVGQAIWKSSDWINYNLNPLYAGFNGVYSLKTGEDFLSGQGMHPAESATSLLSIIPIARFGNAAGIVANASAKVSTRGGLNLFKWGAPQTTRATGWKAGDYMLHLPDRGSPALNWKANYGALRREMRLGRPIYDSYRLPNGNLIPTVGFLNAERSILQGRGWMYNRDNGAWLPPGF